MTTTKSIIPVTALISSTGLLLSLLSLHVLSPEFDPSWRMVSEYANGQYGWLLSLMFVFWAVSTWATAASLTGQLTNKLGKVGWWLLIISGFGEAMAAIFDINHALHSVAALIGIGSFPLAALFISYSLKNHKQWVAATKTLLLLAHLSWISVVLMIVSFVLLITTYMQAGGDMSAGAVTEVPDGVIAIVGWANRFLILVYSAWLLSTAWFSKKLR